MSDIRIVKQYDKSNDPNVYDRPFYYAAGAAGLFSARGQVMGVERDEDIESKKYYTLLSMPYTDLKGNDLTNAIETAYTSPYSEVDAWVHQSAAKSGNYIYMEEISSDKFELGTVENGIIRALEIFERGATGIYDRTSITEYTMTKGEIMERRTKNGNIETYRNVKVTEIVSDFKSDNDKMKEYSYEEIVN